MSPHHVYVEGGQMSRISGKYIILLGPALWSTNYTNMIGRDQGQGIFCDSTAVMELFLEMFARLPCSYLLNKISSHWMNIMKFLWLFCI